MLLLRAPETPLVVYFSSRGMIHFGLPTGGSRIILLILHCSPSESDPPSPIPATTTIYSMSRVHHINTEDAQWIWDLFPKAWSAEQQRWTTLSWKRPRCRRDYPRHICSLPVALGLILGKCWNLIYTSWRIIMKWQLCIKWSFSVGTSREESQQHTRCQMM